MKKSAKITLIVISCFIAVLFVALMIYYFGASYKEFDSLAKKEFAIPGLDTKFVPQGISYDDSSQTFLIAGYMSDGKPSRIYFVNKETGKSEKFVTLKSGDVSYNGHCGGVAVSGDFVYIVGDKYLCRASLSQAKASKNATAIDIIDYKKTGNGCDFVLVSGENLIVGEFYRPKKYDTPKEHILEIEKNETNRAMAYVYKLNPTKELGLDTKTPKAVISLPTQAQGMTFTKNGDIVISTSYSVPSSKILIYSNVLEGTPQKFNLNGQETDLYVLSSKNLKKTIKAPAMSEEIVLVDNRVFVLFESNCAKYRLFNRTRLSNVYSLDI